MICLVSKWSVIPGTKKKVWVLDSSSPLPVPLILTVWPWTWLIRTFLWPQEESRKGDLIWLNIKQKDFGLLEKAFLIWSKLDSEKMWAGLVTVGSRGYRVSAVKVRPPLDTQRGGWVINSWSDLQKHSNFGVEWPSDFLSVPLAFFCVPFSAWLSLGFCHQHPKDHMGVCILVPVSWPCSFKGTVTHGPQPLSMAQCLAS